MKISIITTTHNSASTIRDTLDSIFAQTYQDWELIIEDGLSQDNTLSIIREYEQKSNGRIHVYSEKDEGLYDAMNRGIRHSTGEIIGVLNSDDFYYDEYVLEDINRAMEGQKKGAYMHGWHPAHPTFYARRECYNKYKGFNTKYAISADFELMLRFIEKGQIRNAYLDRYFVKMRMGGESTGSIRNIIKGNRNILRALRDNGFKPSRFYLIKRLIPKAWDMLKYKLKNILHK